MKRADVSASAAQLRLILDAVERGELEATATERARLEGAATTLDVLGGNANGTAG
ncbi:hypothetical protein [Mycolicibacterium mucogenicum]|nr:hypothetical protein [Mycolicibacterium mucogenicum]